MKSGRRATSSASGRSSPSPPRARARSAPGPRRRCCTAWSTAPPALSRVPTEVRPLIERCLAKDPGQRPTAAGLLAEVGALQPTAELAARIDHPRVRPGYRVRIPRPPRPCLTPAAALGSLAALGFVGESATQTTARWRRGAGTERESLLLASAGNHADLLLEEHAPAFGYISSRGGVSTAPARREERAARPLAAAAVGNHWRRYRGSRHSQYRGDRFHRAFVYS